MVILFHDMMHKEIKVYVDNMIVKSRKGENHIEKLQRLFERLKKFQMKFNPTKCTFGATFSKLLGFMIFKRGVEMDLDKIQTI